jgi:hypothetical protein
MTTASKGTLYFERTPAGSCSGAQSGTGSSAVALGEDTYRGRNYYRSHCSGSVATAHRRARVV